MSEQPAQLRRRAGRWTGIAVAACGLLAAQTAAAQQRSLISPSDAQLQRQVRSLGNRVDTAPAGIDVQLRRARRSLIEESRGVYFTPEEARIERDLNQIGRRLEQSERRRAVPSQPRPPIEGELPASYDEEPPRAGRHNSLVAATRLVGRAEAALAAGRPVQARSDLSAARGFLGDVDPGAGPPKARGTLQERMEKLEQRLAAPGKG